MVCNIFSKMASKKNQGVSEKVQEIKRMQKNWLDQRATLSENVVKKTSDARPGRGRGSKTGAASKDVPKKTDTLSWVIGSGSKKKPTSVRARSASPARPTNSRPASGASHPRPSSGKAQVTGGRSSSGRPPIASRPTSSRSDTDSAKKPTSPADCNEFVSKGRTLHSGSEPNLYHRGESEPSSPSDQSSCTTNQSSSSKQNTDQWDFSRDRTSSQSESLTRVAVHSESVQSSDSQLESKLQSISQSHGSYADSVISRSGSRTRDLIAPDAFDKLADQIASKVRADLKQERNRMMQSVGFMGKSVLEGDDDDDENSIMSSHQCSKCKQLMLAPDHTPYVLVPCGHTLCEACAEDRIKCPTCRARVSSTAVNTTLQQVIISATSNQHTASGKLNHLSANPTAEPASHQRCTYNPSEYSSHPGNTINPSSTRLYHSNNREAHQDGWVIPASKQSNLRNDTNYESKTAGYGDQKGTEPGRRGMRKMSPEEQAEKYFNEYQNLLIRCEAVEGEEEEILVLVERKNREITKQKKQISNITSEQDRLREEVRNIEERITALDGHRREYEHHCQELEEDKREEMERLTMVRDMLRGLERGKEKIKLLARNYNVSLD